MPLNPDAFKPNYGPPDGTYVVMFDDAVTHKNDGTPYTTQEGNRQVLFKMVTQDGKKISKYLTLGEGEPDLLRALQSFGVTTEQVQGLEWTDFLDADHWLSFFQGRTAEATVKNGTTKAGKPFTAVYLDKLGAKAERDAKRAEKDAQAAPPPAPVAAPRPAQTAPQPQPARWGAPPPARPQASAQPRQWPPQIPNDDVPY